MDKRRSIFRTAACAVLVLLPLALGAVGCNRIFRPAEWSEINSRPEKGRQRQQPMLRVVQRSNKDQAELSADDIIAVMEHVGFSEEQILALGPDLHAALREAGAAGVQYGDQTEVIFAVSGEHLFIQSRSQGTYIYDITHGQFGGTSSAPGVPR